MRYLYARGCLFSVIYSRKRSLAEDDEGEYGEEALTEEEQLFANTDFLAQLARVETSRVVYKTVILNNQHELRLNRQIIWTDREGKAYKIGPDLSAVASPDLFIWGGELKGGADPAGSDEHWKTAKSAFDRILEATENTGRSKPKLSFIATILVDRVAREAALWLVQGKLTSVYNLTQIAENPEKRETFLRDLAAFLGCGE